MRALLLCNRDAEHRRDNDVKWSKMRSSSHLLAIMREKNCVNGEENEWEDVGSRSCIVTTHFIPRHQMRAIIIVTFLKYLSCSLHLVVI